MEKVIIIEGREIKFRADGNLGRLYRHLFGGRDVFADFGKLQKSLGKEPDGYIEYAKSVNKGAPEDEKNPLFRKEFEEYTISALNNLDQDILENVAYAMAKKAEPELPSIDEWLGGFESVLSIYMNYAEIMELMQQSMLATVPSKNAMAAVR